MVARTRDLRKLGSAAGARSMVREPAAWTGRRRRYRGHSRPVNHLRSALNQVANGSDQLAGWWEACIHL